MINSVRSSQTLWKHFSRASGKLIQKNVRTFASGYNLLDVQVNSKTGVSTIIMKNEPVNSLSLELINELTNAIMEIEKNKGRGMIITSAMPGVFSAGLDLKELYKSNPERMKLYWTALQDMWLNLYSAACPTAAAITGHGPGAGCLIACSCDYRVMVQGKAGIGLNESQLGLPVPTWFADTFRNIVPKRESELALISGKLFSVDEALKVGLVDATATDKEGAVAKAAEYIATLSKFSMTAISQTKLVLRYESIKRLQDNREHDVKMFIKFVTAPEIQKALEFYIEKLKKK